ncbi:MAG: thioredoxin reductase [Bacillota bacterium]|nr:MAG: thioredoxin reductase [Bacillota bacterium]
MKEYDVVAVGLGPAATSAAIYTAMGGYKTLLVGEKGGSLYRAEKIANYYAGGEIGGRELFERGLKQAEAVGAHVVYRQVVEITFAENGFLLKTAEEEYAAKAVLLATGVARNKPKLEGLDAFGGKGVSWCAVCDGFFYRRKKVGVYGAGEYAASEAKYLAGIGCDVTLFTDGRPVPDGAAFANGEKLGGLYGGERLEGVTLANGEKLPLSAMFIAEGVASSGDFAKMLGIETENNAVKVNARCETNVPALFAAGDCTGGLLQVAKAVGQGAVAGFEICRYLKK